MQTNAGCDKPAPSAPSSVPRSPTCDVVVVGGGLVGLTSALLLANYGAHVICIDKHPSSSLHPRAIGYTSRTMEIFRSVGVAHKIPQNPADFKLRRVNVESLSGKWKEETHWSKPSAGNEKKHNKEENGKSEAGSGGAERLDSLLHFSPYRGVAIAQDILEPLLRSRAVELGAEIWMSTQLLSFTIEPHTGVILNLKDRVSGGEFELKAKFMIGADGHKSMVREALGIKRRGRGLLRVVRSVLFRAPVLEDYLKSGVSQFQIKQDDGWEAFLTTYQDSRWVLMINEDQPRSESEYISFIHKAAGRSDFTPEILSSGRWELAALIAERYSDASLRVFLAGDSAHQLPPNRGGFGANTGIEDAHNLAWKLRAVLAKQSSIRLLESYDEERRAIAELRHEQIFVREDYKERGGKEGEKNTSFAAEYSTQLFDDIGLELGQLYRSSCVDTAGIRTSLPPAQRPDLWRGQPGTRAPHQVIQQESKVALNHDELGSTLDWFSARTGAWTLLSADSEWLNQVESRTSQRSLPVQFVDLSGQKEYASSIGIEEGGAALVRPDGYLAWREATNTKNNVDIDLCLSSLAQLSASA
jgi:putative polyketide hydroxylase